MNTESYRAGRTGEVRDGGSLALLPRREQRVRKARQPREVLGIQRRSWLQTAIRRMSEIVCD